MTDTIREQLLIIREEGATNLFDVNTVQRLAFEKGFCELVDFIETDRGACARFILTGETE